MKPTFLLAVMALFLAMSCTSNSNTEVAETKEVEVEVKEVEVEVKEIVEEPAGPQLRHVVLFKFKEGTSEEDIKKVEDAFAGLPAKIPEIKGFEFGTNNSPEGLDKGFTHCFFLTFDSEEGREAYLPHPDHKAFGDVLVPHLEDVLVVDYWTD